jgi:hypothetical protein
MTSSLIIVCFGIPFLIIVFLIIRSTIKSAKFSIEDWDKSLQAFADRMNLPYEGIATENASLSQLNGELKGKEFSVVEDEWEDTDEDGHTTTSYNTSMKLATDTQGLNFKIKSEGFFDKVIQKLGKNDIEFDREEIDKKFKFKSNDEVAFKAFFNITLQDQLLRLPKFRGSISYYDEYVTFEIGGLIRDEAGLNRLESVLGLLIMIAETKK